MPGPVTVRRTTAASRSPATPVYPGPVQDDVGDLGSRPAAPGSGDVSDPALVLGATDVPGDQDAQVRAAVRQAISVSVATGLYGVSFGALSTVAGLSLAQTTVLSLLMFSGGSQFALVGVVGAGGAPCPRSSRPGSSASATPCTGSSSVRCSRCTGGAAPSPPT
ncbi:hypothetical protein GCM10025865_31970 [Paraoerskovia sediminicola]|uniref:AzlC protein n=1 Tax=Paraoerskovia sediminicola TaxID=1138587 RepID=A0ABN6XKP0_9CELL|nr:hypothetical protein GCM10025865_31970 [Paraoerskovia sediminicola]